MHRSYRRARACGQWRTEAGTYDRASRRPVADRRARPGRPAVRLGRLQRRPGQGAGSAERRRAAAVDRRPRGEEQHRGRAAPARGSGGARLQAAGDHHDVEQHHQQQHSDHHEQHDDHHECHDNAADHHDDGDDHRQQRRRRRGPAERRHQPRRGHEPMSTPTEVAGRYTIERRLGAGGMSTVFMAMDTVLERRVAVKLLAEHLADDEAFVARFRREAVAAARLQHPNIVQVFDSGLDPASDRHYIVMEYVEGPSCADLLRDHGTLDVEESVRIVRDACHGLDYAHRAGVVHRDVKPGNLLIASESGTTKLADFGIAKAAEQTRITQVGSVLGTAAYLSPEQASGEESTPASDIYSLGVCAYQFLSGRLPHEYSSLTELALKQQNDNVAPIREFRPEVPPQLDNAIRLCLERDPNARYASALRSEE